MNIEGDGNQDEYVTTALQIFEHCGADNLSTLRVNALMDKFAPFIKTNKAEYSYLKSLLDPEQINPEITVSKLAEILNKYSESQKVKVDFEESFNLRNVQVPHDSDSGISTDGFQLLEELQCELKEKAHVAHQLRSQLDFTDRQHEEAIAALTAERDSLRSHLNMLREENMTLNMTLTHIRRDYEEVCERLSISEKALDETRRELECSKKRLRVLTGQVSTLEIEKITLSELLAKSKEECHHINDMYASRQSALLEQNERLRTEHADLSARLQDQVEAMQTVFKDKVLVESQLKELLNKTNQTHLKMDRSIDISYTEDQNMLTALDSLNADSSFAYDTGILDASITFNEGRPTNISLFDEIRQSFCNMSRHNITEVSTHDKGVDDSYTEIATQTESILDKGSIFDKEFVNASIQTDNAETQDTEPTIKELHDVKEIYDSEIQSKDVEIKESIDAEVQTHAVIVTTNDIATQVEIKQVTQSTQMFIKPIEIPIKLKPAKAVEIGMQTDEVTTNNNNECTYCLECEKFDEYTNILVNDNISSHDILNDVKNEIEKYEDNLNILKKVVDEGNVRNNYLRTVVDDFKVKLVGLAEVCAHQQEAIDKLCCSVASVAAQTELEQVSTCSQADLPCSACVKRNVPNRLRRYLWDPLKCLFQLFAIICFIFALSALYGVTRRWQSPCTSLAPWSWLQLHDLMDLFFHIEYIADVPM